MTDKVLKISTKADLKELNGLEAALKRLEKMGVGVSKAFQGIRLGSAKGQNDFEKQIVNSTKGMQKLQGVSQDTAKAFEWGLGRQMDKNVERLKTYTKRVDVLTQGLTKQQKLVDHLKNSGAGSDSKTYLTATQREKDIRTRLAEASLTKAALMAETGNGGGGGGGAGKWAGRFQTASGILGGAAATAQFVSQAAGMYQEFKKKPDVNAANVRNFESRMINEAAAGDFRSLYYAGKKGKGDKTNLEQAKETGGGLAAGMMKYWGQASASVLGVLAGGTAIAGGIAGFGAAGAAAGAAGLTGLAAGAVAAAPIVAGAAVIGGAGLLGYGAYKSITAGDANVDEANSVEAVYEAKKRQNPFEAATVDYIQQNYDSRWRQDMATQGQAGRAWLGGRTREEGAGFLHSLIRSNGTDGYGTANAVGGLYRMEAQGLDRGAAAGIFSHLSQTNRGGDSKQALADLENILGKAFRAGLKDARLGEELAGAVAEASYNRLGVLDTGKLAESMTAGGGVKTLKDIKDRVAGTAALDDLFQGNGGFAMQGHAIAKSVLERNGINFDSNRMLAIGKASINDLTAGSPILEELGISKEVQQQILKSRMNSVIKNKSLDQGDRTNSATGKFVGGLQDMGNMSAMFAATGGKGAEFEDLVKQGSLVLFNNVDGFKTREEAAQAIRKLYGANTSKDGKATYGIKADGTLSRIAQDRQRDLAKEAKAKNMPLDPLQPGEPGYGVQADLTDRPGKGILATSKEEQFKARAEASKKMYSDAATEDQTKDAMDAFRDFLKQFTAAMREAGIGAPLADPTPKTGPGQ